MLYISPPFVRELCNIIYVVPLPQQNVFHHLGKKWITKTHLLLLNKI